MILCRNYFLKFRSLSKLSARTMKTIIIDTDCGVDDAEAIILALASPEKCKVLGITCVTGNVSLEKVGPNVLRTLKICGKENIPVFCGASKSLVGKNSGRAKHVHGNDGFGGIADTITVDPNDIQSQSAVEWMIQTVRAAPKTISLIALGPLTNLALAQRIDSGFSENLKDILVMGGNYKGIGNTSPAAEFNFYSDPEAAFAVLNEFQCPTTLVTWEFCHEHYLSWDWYRQWLSVNTPMSIFLDRFLRDFAKLRTKTAKGYFSCDLIAMAVFLNSEDLVEESKKVFVSVELQGELTRGQCVVDWQNRLGNEPNLTLPTKMDLEKLKIIYEKMVRQ